uniref:Uncharacterized protein n=1 Tax=Lotharella globosa TaxID=91324 RepID=A0A6V3KG97_9EUKA|mmetsp:Transcript_6881/g.13058  ORF Transcript_6881/g.13058 Transcript_6881/m.13058 type:complete len:329 (-) Transcript_6881:1295-2281(-)
MMIYPHKYACNYGLVNYTPNTNHMQNQRKDFKRILLSNKSMFFLKKSPYFYIYKTKNFTLSFTKHLVVKNGFIYMLLENIIYLNYLINKYQFQPYFSFIQLKKDILQVSRESSKKNGIIKILLKPYKVNFYANNVKMVFIILFFPKKQKLYSKINLKILKLQPFHLDLTCLLFLQNINEMSGYFRKKNIKILTVNHQLILTPLFNGMMGAIKEDTLFLTCNTAGSKNPNLTKLVTKLKNLIKKTRTSDDIGFSNIEIITRMIDYKSYTFSNCFIINDDLDIALVKQINQRSVGSTSTSRLISIIQFLIDEELTPKVNTYKYTPIPYFN